MQFPETLEDGEGLRGSASNSSPPLNNGRMKKKWAPVYLGLAARDQRETWRRRVLRAAANT